MVMDLTEPIPAIAPSYSPSPERLLKLAIVVGTAGVIALIVAVVVLVWTVTGVSAPVVSQQASMPADIESKPIPAAPAALVPEPAPAPVAETVAAPAPAPAAPASAPITNAAGTADSSSEILSNPAMAAIAPTAPAPASSAAAPTVTLPTVTLPEGDANGLNWDDLNSNLQNAAASYLWQNSGADATTGALVGVGSGLASTALGVVGNNAGNLVNTLILAQLGYYGTPNPGGGILNTALAAPAALSQIGVGVPSVPSLGVPNSIGIPGTPIGTQIGPPQLPQIGPPQLPSLPRPGIGIPGTPIGIGF